MGGRTSNCGKSKGPGKTILAIILAIADIVLLAVIISGIANAKNSDSAVETAEKKRSTKRTTIERSLETEKDPEKILSKEVKDPEKILSEEVKDPEEISSEEIKEPEPVSSESAEELSEPSLSDFMWYYDGVYWNGIPENSSRISDSEYLFGNWKIFIWFDHEKDSDTYWIEFGNVDLDFNNDNVEVVVKPYMLYPPSGAEPVDLTDSGTDKYHGKFDGDVLNATGAGNFHITNFYTLNDGKQYAVGSIDEPDGTPTVIALVRDY